MPRQDESAPLVKRYRAGEQPVLTEISWLLRGDVFWYELNGKPIPDPSCPKDNLIFNVAVNDPVFKRCVKTGKTKFLGIKIREATYQEVKRACPEFVHLLRSIRIR